MPRLPLAREIVVGDGCRQPLRLGRVLRGHRKGNDIGVCPDQQSLNQCIRGLIQLFRLLRFRVGVRAVISGSVQARKTEALRQIGELVARLELRVMVEAKLLSHAQCDRFRFDNVDLGVHCIETQGIDEERDRLLNRCVKLSLRIEDEYLDRGRIA